MADFLVGMFYSFIGVWSIAFVYCLVRFFMTYEIKLERRV